VDASGIPAVVRTSLPANYGVENFVTGSRDQFYVVLYYVNLKHPEKDMPKVNITWPYYKIWFASQPEENGALFGVGANLSFEYADYCFQRFAAKGFLPESTPDHVEKASTPYRRPPYSFVADGFAAIGDSACITNPWTGEGVPYAWCLGAIAADEYGRAMKNGAYPSREAAWNINIRYQQEQGALYAQNLAMLCGASGCTEEENDYEFKHAIIYEDETEKGKGNLMLKLLKAFVSGGISPKSLGNLLNAAGIGGKIFKHYLAYPKTPEGLDAWIQTADALWKKAGSMADLAEQDLARNPPPKP
jgi:flavin-dependent dehydrogenase